ncbi:TolC family protein [Paraburkholderia dipogonis]|uniref:TolC family protein n=1 Tax=Paraburkholderia dipogonis TaxID=1211383 RepID=UPI0035EE1727
MLGRAARRAGRCPIRWPIGVPSEKLVQRRPDIRKAGPQLHAATATIGMAKADFYPRISLNGSAGFQSLATVESRQLGVRPVCLSDRRSRCRYSKADA